jgi:hypothetical protein
VCVCVRACQCCLKINWMAAQSIGQFDLCRPLPPSDGPIIFTGNVGSNNSLHYDEVGWLPVQTHIEEKEEEGKTN